MLKKLIRQLTCVILTAVLVIAVPLSAKAAEGAAPGTVFPLRYSPDVSTAVSTQTTYLNGIFFTVDCYHDRILYNDSGNPGAELMSWKVMADDLNKPHSICSDGLIYLVVDTDNNRVVTYTRLVSGEFMELQSFQNVGIRPHYCEYDAATSSFYVWSSYTGEMFIYKRPAGSFALRLADVKKLDYMYGLYTRSFTIDGNNIILCSQGAGGMIVVNKRNFNLVGIYPVAEELGGLVQVVKVGSHYYLSTSSDRYGNQNMAMTVRSDTLAGFASSATYTDVTAQLGGIPGICVPYYMSNEGGVCFVRVIGMGAGYEDFGTCFTEDVFGNIIVGGRIS
ncbi:MAG: hypothetical protein K5871_08725 [Lachnospiraceae bacterium]|nr:hypothetical protein [Lachnospiraceae bacterium]